jgi:hypothetical protein
MRPALQRPQHSLIAFKIGFGRYLLNSRQVLLMLSVSGKSFLLGLMLSDSTIA